MCAKGRIRHEVRLRLSARNLPHHVLADVICEDSKLELVLKDIRRLKETTDGQLR